MIRIFDVEPLAGFRLNVTFDDGLEGVFPVEPERRGGVFLKLLDPRIFNAVVINPDFGCVEWPGGLDLCRDTMHEIIIGSETKTEPSAVLREGPETARREIPKKG